MYEIYNNTYSEGDLYLAQGVMMYLRGGQHLVHDNTFNTTNDFPISLTVYYSTDLIAHRIKNTFVWNNVWNAHGVNQGAATQVQVASDTNGTLTLNTDYFLRAPQAGDIYYPYTPYTYPHPLRGTSTTLMPPTGLTASVQSELREYSCVSAACEHVRRPFNALTSELGRRFALTDLGAHRYRPPVNKLADRGRP